MRLYASPWESGKPAPSLQAKYVYGTVPVEADGSAYFTAPAERPIYFQALDDQHNEVQRMRSYIHLQPGERLSCVGCHEPRNSAPNSGPADSPLALRRAPQRDHTASFSAPGRFHMPGWSSRCWTAGAENATQPKRQPAASICQAAGTLEACRPRSRPWSGRGPIRPEPRWSTSSTTGGASVGPCPAAQPLRFGTAVSRLVEVIDSQHSGVELTAAQRSGCGCARRAADRHHLDRPELPAVGQLHARAELGRNLKPIRDQCPI